MKYPSRIIFIILIFSAFFNIRSDSKVTDSSSEQTQSDFDQTADAHNKNNPGDSESWDSTSDYDDSSSSSKSSSSYLEEVIVLTKSKEKAEAELAEGETKVESISSYRAEEFKTEWNSYSTINQGEYARPYDPQISSQGEWKSVTLDSNRASAREKYQCSPEEALERERIYHLTKEKISLAPREAVQVVGALRKCECLSAETEDLVAINYLVITESKTLNDWLQKTKYEIQQIIHEGDGWIVGGSGRFVGIKSNKDVEKIHKIIDKLESNIAQWKEDKGLIYIDALCDLDCKSPKYCASKPYKANWDNKIKNEPCNRDLFKVIELCNDRKFEPVKQIRKQYYDRVSRTKDGWIIASPEYTQYLQIDHIYHKALNAHKQEVEEAQRALAHQAVKAKSVAASTNKAFANNQSIATEIQSDQILDFKIVFLKDHVPQNVAQSMENLQDEGWVCDVTFDLHDNPRFVSRSEAFCESTEKSSFIARRYELSVQGKKLLHESGIGEKAFTTCYGNQLQQAVHTELVLLVDNTAALYYQCSESQEVKEISIHIVTFAEIGSAYNKAGHIDKALPVTDFCWALLDCGIAVGEGALQGVENVANAIVHPIDTAVNLAKATATAGYYLGKVLHFVVTEDDVLADLDPEKYEKQCLERGEQLFAVADAIEHKIKTTPPREAIKELTAFGVEAWLTGKLLGATGKFFREAKSKAVEVVQKIKKGGAQKVVVVTAEGIPLEMKIAEEGSNSLFNKMEKNNPRVGTFGKAYHFSPKALEEGVKHVINDKVRITHIFEKSMHNLNHLVTKLGGQEKTIREVLIKLSGKVPYNGIFRDIEVNIADHTVHVRGRVMDGIPKIGTMFIK